MICRNSNHSAANSFLGIFQKINKHFILCFKTGIFISFQFGLSTWQCYIISVKTLLVAVRFQPQQTLLKEVRASTKVTLCGTSTTLHVLIGLVVLVVVLVLVYKFRDNLRDRIHRNSQENRNNIDLTVEEGPDFNEADQDTNEDQANTSVLPLMTQDNGV